MAPQSATSDLVGNFLLSGGAPNTTYLTQLVSNIGSTEGGDLNAQYGQMYFSLTQLNNLIKQKGFCPIEMLLFGAFPNARYLSASLYDMHYDIAQHVTDLDMDPISVMGGTEANPFLPGTPLQQNDYYLVPVGLGTIPSATSITTAGCGITPSETDNLMDATQRHLSVDWNTDYLYAPYVGAAGAHMVDTPSHSNPNTAGAAIVRFYQPLDPPCTNPSMCPSPVVPPVYAAFRDTATGCPIAISTINNGGNKILYTGTNATTAAGYAFSGLDPSPAANWLDKSAEASHNTYSNSTPDSCYSDPTGSSTPNLVAWTRSPEWVFLPAPDDAYIGGAISMADLNHLASGTCPGSTQTGPCAILLQFQLPTMPDTPCNANGNGTYPCSLTGSEQLRYMSLSLGYNASSVPYVDDPDGLNQAAATGPVSLISLSDAAFATSSSGGYKYVNLLVNVDPSSNAEARFNSFVNNHSPVTAFQGVTPRSNGSAYTVQQLGNGYTAVDLTTLPNFSGWYSGSPASYQESLLLNIRNTLPGSTFAESGLAVPFSTTQYLGGGLGIMGPYAPVVSYVPLSQPQVGLPNFPAAGQPTGTPSPNAMISPSNPQNYPEQYWPSQGTGAPQYLVCGTAPAAPVINFVGTQFSITVDHPNIPGSPLGCGQMASQNNCSQIFAQSPQATGNASGNWPPGLPLTIEGSGFGTLPVMNLPYATTGWGSTAYLTITDTPTSGTGWSSPSSYSSSNNKYACQMYILKWSDTSITVVPNVEEGNMNGMNTVLSPLTETNPFSLAASSTCPVTANDSITVKVINPQNPTATPATINVPVNSFAGSLN